MNLQERIEKLEKELAEIKAEVSVKPWEPQSGEWFISNTGIIYSCNGSNPELESFGVVRKTIELSKRSAVMMRRFNRLLAYHDEFCPEHDPAGKWDGDTNNYHVYCESGEWKIGFWTSMNFNTVYFPKDVAKELCRKLNSGEVLL